MKFELVVLVSYLRRSPEDYELCMPTPESAEVYQEKKLHHTGMSRHQSSGLCGAENRDKHGKISECRLTWEWSGGEA